MKAVANTKKNNNATRGGGGGGALGATMLSELEQRVKNRVPASAVEVPKSMYRWESEAFNASNLAATMKKYQNKINRNTRMRLTRKRASDDNLGSSVKIVQKQNGSYDLIQV